MPWSDYGRSVNKGKLLDLLLLAAALTRSISALVKRFAFGFSHESARKAVDANLPDVATLTNGLLDVLYCFGYRALYRRKWVVAIDLHNCPFYGARKTAGIVGGQKKHGSKYFYAYATAVLVHQQHRFTVGQVAVTDSQKPHEIVAALLAQIEEGRLNLRGVVLDSGFDSPETLLLLQEKQVSYTVPLRRKGNRNNRRNAHWQLEVGTVTKVEWKTDKANRPVSTQAVVLKRPGEKDKKVYAFGGWGAEQVRTQTRRAALAKRWYRKRFGIETRYRQMNEMKAKTTKKDVGDRLLLIRIALLLRQVWVWLTHQLARQWGLTPSETVEELRLARMREWLAEAIKRKYKEQRSLPLNAPLLPLTLPKL